MWALAPFFRRKLAANGEDRCELNKSVPLLLGLLLLGGILYLVCFRSESGREAVHPANEAMASVTLPGGVALSVPLGSFDFKLAQYLADSADSTVPRRFVLDHLNFESASTKMTPESEQTAKTLTAILKAYPAVNIRLEAYTDNEGAVEANKQLSQGRAEAVRASLVARGIDAKRIDTLGWGEAKPMASNNTVEGRAQNRRLEMIVLSK
jgi:outer membrane protein OmpA-like peptidoglycan-associated protein